MFLEADIFAPPHHLEHLFHKTNQHKHINIMSKKVHSRRAIADVKDAFLEVVRHYRQNVGHLFLDLSAYNGNEVVLIRDYVGFIHAVDLPPDFFEFFFVADKSIFKNK